MGGGGGGAKWGLNSIRGQRTTLQGIRKFSQVSYPIISLPAFINRAAVGVRGSCSACGLLYFILFFNRAAKAGRVMFCLRFFNLEAIGWAVLARPSVFFSFVGY